MVRWGLVGRAKRRWTKTTIPDPTAPLTPLDRLGRAFAPGSCALDSVYVGDITYIRTHEGWVYLATAIDLASRRVVGFAMADHMHASLVCDALATAIELRHPAPGLVFHSDRGSSTPRVSSGRCSMLMAPSSRSRDPASAGTMRSPRASSRRSRRNSSTARRSRREPPRAGRSSSSSRSSTTEPGCTRRSTTARRPSTRRRGGTQARLRRHSQPVRRTGARPSLCVGLSITRDRNDTDPARDPGTSARVRVGLADPARRRCVSRWRRPPGRVPDTRGAGRSVAQRGAQAPRLARSRVGRRARVTAARVRQSASPLAIPPLRRQSRHAAVLGGGGAANAPGPLPGRDRVPRVLFSLVVYRAAGNGAERLTEWASKKQAPPSTSGPAWASPRRLAIQNV